MELAGAELPHPLSVVFGERRHEHGPDRHVDADAEGVGAADDPQQPALGERLDEAPIAREHAGVMHADARPHVARQGAAERRGEPEAADRVGDRVALLAAHDPDARQRLRPLHRGRLREVHDVDRRLVGLQQLFDRLVDRRHGVGEVQRHRPLDPRDARDGPARPALEVFGDRRDVAERGRHEDELRARKEQQRHLPRPPAIGVAVVVELVHHDLVDRGIRALTQREVREDLGRAADDRRVGVDGRIPGHHADVLGAEDVDEGEELLADEGLDRRGVIGASTVREREGMGGDRDERLAGAGRRRQDDVRARHDLDDRFVLRGVQGQPSIGRPVDEARVRGVRVRPARDGVEQIHGHHPSLSGRWASTGLAETEGCRGYGIGSRRDGRGVGLLACDVRVEAAVLDRPVRHHAAPSSARRCRRTRGRRSARSRRTVR